MNKQEVLEKVKNLKPYEPDLYEYDSEELERFKEGFLDAKTYAELAVEGLDEPEKIVVPQCVADWYEDYKGDLEFNIYNLCIEYRDNGQGVNKDLKKWFGNDSRTKPIETLVKMKLYGYEVEKEKLYTARLKGIAKEKESYVYKIIESGEIYLSDLVFIEGKSQVYFTQTELENLKYWNNPAFEIVEVAE